MFTLRNVAQVETIEEAYKILMQRKTNVILGGCAFLKLGSQKIDTGVDLSRLGLDYIREVDDGIEIGAYATLRDMEVHPGLNQRFSGLLEAAAKNIIGVQFRNTATIGGSVYSKYGFSDIITALLALDADVLLYKGGRQKLAHFLSRPFERDVLTGVFVSGAGWQTAYQSLRKSASDYPVLNVAAARLNGQWRIAVGARPGRAGLATTAAALLSTEATSEGIIDEAASLAAEELTFGSNMRGTADYRKSMCRVLVKRAVKEALQ